MAALLWCATCALPASASHVHEWEQTDVAYPTCTSDGYYVLKCKVCGQTKTEITDHAFGHSWVLIEDVPVTCYSDGYYVQQCENCGEKITTTIPKLDHEWEQISIEEYSTCQTAGYAVQQCIYCGTKRQVALPLATHSWGEWTVVKEPSDNTAGFRQRVCTVCGSIDSASFYPDGTLYPGCNLTEGVVSLQSMLIDLGYLNGTADGSYGPKTQAAVIAFQTEKGLKSDGIAWPETVDAVTADWNTAMGIVTENPTVILPYCRQNGSRYE
ncbi:MAG: peptidoglycan-binding protein, partial [Clostridia bacterium]|nr:peptidoglycan-binding protein [Clostridia bacterium]